MNIRAAEFSCQLPALLRDKLVSVMSVVITCHEISEIFKRTVALRISDIHIPSTVLQPNSEK